MNEKKDTASLSDPQPYVPKVPRVQSPIRQLTDTEFKLVKIINGLKKHFSTLDTKASDESVKIAVMTSAAENQMWNTLAQKFEITYADIQKEKYDLRVMSGHFVEIVDEKHTSSGE